MNRIAFLKALEDELDGEISVTEINRNLQYYDSYIREQIELGLTEEEVMEQLGDPRLIARTISDTVEAAQQSDYEETTGYYQEEPSRKSVFYFNGKTFDFSKWYMKLLIGIVVLLTVFIVISVVVLIVRVALWLALPVLVIWGIIYLLQRFFK